MFSMSGLDLLFTEDEINVLNSIMVMTVPHVSIGQEPRISQNCLLVERTAEKAWSQEQEDGNCTSDRKCLQ